MPDTRTSPPAPRNPRAQAHITASEAAPEGVDDLFFPDNQEDTEQVDEYTDDDYFAMMVAQGHFDTEVEDFSYLDDSDIK